MRHVGNAITVLLAALALAVGGRSLFSGPSRGPSVLPRLSEESAWLEYAEEGRVVAADSVGVTVVEFGDFECRFCREFAVYVDSLRALGVPIRLVYRHAVSPASIRGRAMARLSECAAAQARFPEAYRLFFDDGTAVDSGTVSVGIRVGVPDLEAFSSCAVDTLPQHQLQLDSLAADRLAVRGTPTILIQHLRYNGLPPFDTLRALVERVRR